MTLEEAQNMLDSWLAAEQAVMKGQSYSIDGMSVSRVSAQDITAKISYWSRVVDDMKCRRSSSCKQPGVRNATWS